jgi:hypothetical protein
MMTNFNLDMNEVIQSFDAGNIDHSEKEENEEVLKEIGNLRENIEKNLQAITLLEDEVPIREEKFYNEFDNLDSEQRELFIKFENEFILNSHLYFEEEKNKLDLIGQNKNKINKDIINEENIGKNI